MEQGDELVVPHGDELVRSIEFRAAGHAGGVDVSDHAYVPPQPADHVAIHDLHMVDVKHELLARPATIPRARVAETERKGNPYR